MCFAVFGPALVLYSSCAAAAVFIGSLIVSVLFRTKKPVRMVLNLDNLPNSSEFTYSPSRPNASEDGPQNVDNPSLKSDPGRHPSALPGVHPQKKTALIYRVPRLNRPGRIRSASRKFVVSLASDRNVVRCL